jgi:hypothetical protein
MLFNAIAALGITTLLPSLVSAGVASMNTPMAPLVPGSGMAISWNIDGTPFEKGFAALELISRDAGSVVSIAPQISVGQGKYNWAIPADTAEGQYYVRMTGEGQPKFTGDFHINNKDGTSKQSFDPSGKPSTPANHTIATSDATRALAAGMAHAAALGTAAYLIAAVLV